MKRRGRPVGSGKPPGEKYILRAFKFPPVLWATFSGLIPKQERSETIRRYMEQEIEKRKSGAAEKASIN
jgi:hypothetical protein